MKWEVDLVREYQLATGNIEISTSAVANWAIANDKYKPDPVDEAARLATKLSNALRKEHFTDPQGRSVRLTHAVTNREGQLKMTSWYAMKSISPENMKRSLQQRREQSLADNIQMKADQDSYNENFNQGEQISLIFDYTLDLLEIDEVRKSDLPRSA